MEQKLRSLIKLAMIEKKETGNANRYQTFKNILEKAQKIAKEQRVEVLTDTMIIDAAKKEIKQLEELLTYCTANSSKEKETKECILCAKEILPQMAAEDEIEKYLNENHVEKNIGVCMKALKKKFGDALDGKTASFIVKKYISQ